MGAKILSICLVLSVMLTGCVNAEGATDTEESRIFSDEFCDSVDSIRLYDFDETVYTISAGEEAFEDAMEMLPSLKGHKCDSPELAGSFMFELISGEDVYEFGATSGVYIYFADSWYELEEPFDGCGDFADLVRGVK